MTAPSRRVGLGNDVETIGIDPIRPALHLDAPRGVSPDDHIDQRGILRFETVARVFVVLQSPLAGEIGFDGGDGGLAPRLGLILREACDSKHKN